MRSSLHITILQLALLLASITTAQADDNARARNDKPSIVLVHGAFADGGSWNAVIPLLQHAGYEVTAVQNSLFSLADDIATTKRVIDAQPGEVIVVGHSYGGAVISGAAAGNPKVRALVYIAAFAPDDGEPVGAFLEKYPIDLATALVPDAAGFVTIDRGKFHAVFAADLPQAVTRVLATSQKPLVASAFGASVPHAAWHDVPTWYVVAQQDRAINPALERFYASRMQAKTIELPTSHVPFLSRPHNIAQVILKAATAN